MYRHILIPTDGSELAERGVTHGLALAKSLGCVSAPNRDPARKDDNILKLSTNMPG